jgi:hypothetical protein
MVIGSAFTAEILQPYTIMSGKNLALTCCLMSIVISGLTACADTRWPSSLTGEPPPAVTQAARVVARPTPDTAQDFPNLASVPDMPTDYTPLAEREQHIKDLNQARQDALAIRQRLGGTP